MHRLLSDRLLCWIEPILASYPSLGLLRTWDRPKAAHSISERPIREAKNSSSKWPCGHKSNAESKHIYFSFISIPYKLNLPHKADVEPQFASKTSSLDVSHGPRTHSPWHKNFENQPGDPASLLNWASPGTTRRLAPVVLKKICSCGCVCFDVSEKNLKFRSVSKIGKSCVMKQFNGISPKEAYQTVYTG